LYQVSNLGRIKSLPKEMGNKYFSKEKIMKLQIINGNRYQIRLIKNKLAKNYRVHRLVAEAFIPNPNNLPQINHKDENPLNNNVSNLEWCTRTYNILYGKAGKERYEKMRLTQRYSRKDLQPVECINKENNEIVRRFASIGEAVREMFGIAGRTHIRSNIAQCCQGKGHVKTVMGYKWRYAND
jgi:hypothetical protein